MYFLSNIMECLTLKEISVDLVRRIEKRKNCKARSASLSAPKPKRRKNARKVGQVGSCCGCRMMIYDQFCVSKCHMLTDHSHDAVFYLDELKLDITNSPFFLFPKSLANFPEEVKICLSLLVSSCSISFVLVKTFFTQRLSISPL